MAFRAFIHLMNPGFIHTCIILVITYIHFYAISLVVNSFY